MRLEMVSRRDLIKGCAAVGAAAILGDAKAVPVRGASGGRGVLLARASDKDDAYYRQIYEMILTNTLPPDSELELTLSNLRSRSFASLANLKSLTVHGLLQMTGGYVFQDTPIETLILPDLVSCSNFYAYGASKLKTIYCPNLSQRMLYLCYMGSSVLSDIYITNSTCSQIMAIPNFPGCNQNQNTNYANMVFHGSDGDVVYNGTSWVIA